MSTPNHNPNAKGYIGKELTYSQFNSEDSFKIIGSYNSSHMSVNLHSGTSDGEELRSGYAAVHLRLASIILISLQNSSAMY